jgi:hypothetical protein
MLQGRFHHFPGMDFGMTDSAGEQNLVGNEAVLVIQKQHHKHFPFFPCKLQA